MIFANIKAPLARALGKCEDDLELLRLANEAESRLLNRALTPVGSVVRYRFCARQACVVLPRQIRTIEGMAVCGYAASIRPDWYEYVPSGPGRLDASSCGLRAVDHGFAVAFDDVIGSGRYIRVYADATEDAGKRIILRYYRGDTMEKVYTTDNGVTLEGEAIELKPGGIYAKTTYPVMAGGLYGVHKDPTTRPVRLYEYDGIGNTKALAWYEPTETEPTYRKMFLPGLGGHTTTVDILARLQHIPFAADYDPIVIGNVSALKLMAMAIAKEEEFRLDESAAFEAKAIGELEGELSAHFGSGITVSPSAEPGWGASQMIGMV